MDSSRRNAARREFAPRTPGGERAEDAPANAPANARAKRVAAAAAAAENGRRAAVAAAIALSVGRRWRAKATGRLAAPPAKRVLDDHWVVRHVDMPRIRLRPNDAGIRRSLVPRAVKVGTLDLRALNALNGRTGNRIRRGDIVANRAADVSKAWIEEQTRWIFDLPDYELGTLFAYTCGTYAMEFMRLGRLPVLKFPGLAFALNLQMMRVARILGDAAYVPSARLANGPGPTVRALRKVFEDPGADMLRRTQAYGTMLDMDAFTHEAVIMAMRMFNADLGRIIDAAPPVRTPMVVYRGSSEDEFASNVGRGTTMSKTVVSTSFCLPVAKQFSGSSKPRPLQRLTLMPGVRAVLAAAVNKFPNGECEVILNAGAKYTFVKRGVRRFAATLEDVDAYRVTDVEVWP
jgi:hypothetical protein